MAKIKKLMRRNMRIGQRFYAEIDRGCIRPCAYDAIGATVARVDSVCKNGAVLAEVIEGGYGIYVVPGNRGFEEVL